MSHYGTESIDMGTTFEGLLKAGAYDDIAVRVHKETKAEVVLLAIIGGRNGNGMSMTCLDPAIRMKMPSLLRKMADLLEQAKKNAENQ